jgi:hypothetical protein
MPNSSKGPDWGLFSFCFKGRWQGHPPFGDWALDAEWVTELHHTLQAALARLPAEDRRFCAALAHRPVTALAAEGFGSRSALYRRLDGALTVRYATRAAEERQAAGKDTGTIRFDDGDFTVVADLPKRVDWDQDRLAAMVGRIRAAGDDPAQYVDIAFKVPERKYAAWPDAIRAGFEPARTVRPGTLKIEIVPQGGDQ